MDMYDIICGTRNYRAFLKWPIIQFGLATTGLNSVGDGVFEEIETFVFQIFCKKLVDSTFPFATTFIFT